jgi:translation elongation factor P/translation initiation factor 5A
MGDHLVPDSLLSFAVLALRMKELRERNRDVYDQELQRIRERASVHTGHSGHLWQLFVRYLETGDLDWLNFPYRRVAG